MNRDALRSPRMIDYVEASFAAILDHNLNAFNDLRIELCSMRHYSEETHTVSDALSDLFYHTSAAAAPRPFAIQRKALKSYLTNPPAYMSFATRNKPHPWDKTPDFSRWETLIDF